MSEFFDKETMDKSLVSMDELDGKCVRLAVVHLDGYVCLSAKDEEGKLYILRHELEGREGNPILAVQGSKPTSQRSIWRIICDNFHRKG